MAPGAVTSHGPRADSESAGESKLARAAAAPGVISCLLRPRESVTTTGGILHALIDLKPLSHVQANIFLCAPVHTLRDK